ncbi:hypothetical protein D5045_22920 [Verminephrobacter eiseniae]|nr:hypothetical protein [Verminephrobacter eiseniae]
MVDWVDWVEIWLIGWSADLRTERPPQWIHILGITASAPLDQRVNDHGALAPDADQQRIEVDGGDAVGRCGDQSAKRNHRHDPVLKR